MGAYLNTLARTVGRDLGMIALEILVSLREAFAQRRLGSPAETFQLRRVDELARRAVRARGVVDELAFEADDLGHRAGELRDGHVLADADIDHLVAGVALHQEHAGVVKDIREQELTPRRAGAPDRDL